MSIEGKAARGAAWTVASSVASRALGLVGTLVLIRFVTPADYGEVSAATVVVMTANQLTTLGVGVYTIANRDVTHEEMFHASFIHIGLGVLACLAMLMLGRPLSSFLSTPNLYRYLPALALAGLLDRVALMPERVLIRTLSFRRISLIRSAGEVTYALSSVVTAWLGWGAMSVVVGNIARAVVRTGWMVASVKLVEWFAVARLRLALLGKLAKYGFTITVGAVAHFGGRRWDNLLVGHLFGPAVMGEYNLAYNLADIPATQVGEQITDVMQASYGQMEPEARRNMLVRSIGVIALVTFPLAVGLGAIAPTLGALFLNRKWAGAAAMLVVLSTMSIVRPLWGSIASFMLVSGGPRILAILEWLTVGALLGGIATLGRLSPEWACAAVGLAFTAQSIAGLFLIRAEARVSVAACLGRLWPPLLACAPLAGAVVGARHILVRVGCRWPLVQLIVELIAGAGAYLGAALVVAPDSSRQVIDLIRSRRQRRGLAKV